MIFVLLKQVQLNVFSWCEGDIGEKIQTSKNTFSKIYMHRMVHVVYHTMPCFQKEAKSQLSSSLLVCSCFRSTSPQPPRSPRVGDRQSSQNKSVDRHQEYRSVDIALPLEPKTLKLTVITLFQLGKMETGTLINLDSDLDETIILEIGTRRNRIRSLG